MKPTTVTIVDPIHLGATKSPCWPQCEPRPAPGDTKRTQQTNKSKQQQEDNRRTVKVRSKRMGRETMRPPKKLVAKWHLAVSRLSAVCLLLHLYFIFICRPIEAAAAAASHEPPVSDSIGGQSSAPLAIGNEQTGEQLNQLDISQVADGERSPASNGRLAQRSVVQISAGGGDNRIPLSLNQDQMSSSASASGQRQPRFGREPPAYVEYSNSTGAQIHCTPSHLVVQPPPPPSTANHAHAPIQTNWYRVLASGEQQHQQKPEERILTLEEAASQQQQQQQQLGGNRQPARFVRRDGSLVISPFQAGQFRPELHAANYRCCLTNGLGTICSRLVRTQAVIDGHLSPEVFDELAPSGAMASFKCQLPPGGGGGGGHLHQHQQQQHQLAARRQLDFVGWLKDDKPLARSLLYDATRLARKLQHFGRADDHKQQLLVSIRGSNSTNTGQQQQQQPGSSQVKYLLLRNGAELVIRNASQTDVAKYKCVVRDKLTGQMATSPIGGQLIVEPQLPQYPLVPSLDSNSKQSSVTNDDFNEMVKLVVVRELDDVIICANSFKFKSLMQADGLQASSKASAAAAAVGRWYQWLRVGQPQVDTVDWTTATAAGRHQTKVAWPNGHHQVLGTDHSSPFRQLDSCLSISQIQLKHAGDYVCELLATEAATVPRQPLARTRFRLIVLPANPLAGQWLQLQLTSSGGQPALQQQAPLRPQGKSNRLLAPGQHQYAGGQPQDQHYYLQLGSQVQLGCQLQLDGLKQLKMSPSNDKWPPASVASLGGLQVADQVVWLKDGKQVAAASLLSASGTGDTATLSSQLNATNVISIDPFEATMQSSGLYQCQTQLSTTRHLRPRLEQLFYGVNSSSPPMERTNAELQAAWHEFEWELELYLLEFSSMSSQAVHLELQLQRPQLIQKFPPTQTVLVPSSEDDELATNSSLVLECSASGVPAPSILWFLDDFLLASSLRPLVLDAATGDSDADADDADAPSHQEISLNWPDETMLTPSEQLIDLLASRDSNSQTSRLSNGASLYYSLWQLSQGRLAQTGKMANGEEPQSDEQLLGQLPIIENQRFRVSVTRLRAAGRQRAGHKQPQAVISRLNISHLDGTESGRYKCLALNQFGQQAQHSGLVQLTLLTGTPGGDTAMTASNSSNEVKLRHYQPGRLQLVHGRRAQLACPLIPMTRLVESGGSPGSQPLIEWFLNRNQRLPTSHTRQQLDTSASGSQQSLLNLLMVDSKLDSGLYSCHQQQQQQQQQEQTVDPLNNATISVSVGVEPQIDSQTLPELVLAQEGTRTKLICSIVQGDHPLDIKWLKRLDGAHNDQNSHKFVRLANGIKLSGYELMQNSPPIPGDPAPMTLANLSTSIDGYQQQQQSQSQEVITLHQLEDSSLLTFKQISHLDSGSYLCVAQNQVGLAMRRVKLSVQFGPSWSVEPEPLVTVRLGHRLQLDCAAHAMPMANLVWTRQLKGPSALANNKLEPQPANINSSEQDDLQFVDIQQTYRQYSLPNGTLIIEQVELADSGWLRCEATNGIGSGLSKAVRLQVQMAPQFVHRQQQQQQQQVFGQLLQQIELRCAVQGDQPMQLDWFKLDGGDQIGGDQQLGDAPTDEGEQQQPIVSDSQEVEGSGARKRVVIEQRSGQVLESTLRLSNLSRLDSGQYLCLASNEFGWAEQRVQLVVQEPPEAPDLLRPIKTTARQATLTFKRPYQGQSHIRRYAIHYRQLGSGLQAAASAGFGHSSQLEFLDEMATHHQRLGGVTVSNDSWQQAVVEAPIQQPDQQQQQHQLVQLNLCCLRPFTRYLVRLRAINDIGQSELSRLASLLTDEETIGGPPLDVGVEPTGAHSLKVRWRAPARHLWNGLVRGYYIGYRPIGGPAVSNFQQQQQSVGGKQEQARDGGQSVQMTAQMFEVNNNQQQSQGEQYQYKNVQLLAEPLVDPNQQPVASTATTTTGGLLSFWSSSSTMSHNQQVETNSSVSSQVYTSYLTNLRRKTSYSIIVQAYNKIGAGPRSDQIVVSTLDAAPPMSPIMRLVSVNYNSAQLAWMTRRFNNMNGNHDNINNNNNHLNASSNLLHDSMADELLLSSSEEQQQLQSPVEDQQQLNYNFELDDQQAYYTINYLLEDKTLTNQQQSNSKDLQQQQQQQWQQRKLFAKRHQPSNFVLNNLRCGSIYSAYMTATNSLGQSEPGETVRFQTLGAAPLAPTQSRDFITVNTSFVVLHLSAWQNSGCPISSFLIKYKPINGNNNNNSNNKWVVLEHQVSPTVQTVTIAGVAVFSLRPLSSDDHNNNNNYDQDSSVSAGGSGQSAAKRIMHNHLDADQPNKRQARQQALNDFVLRQLGPTTAYKLTVEAYSESGSTLAEYEFDTTNLTSATIAIQVNGPISPLDQQQSANDQQLRIKQQHSTSEFDFSDLSAGAGNGLLRGGGQTTTINLMQQARYAIGVWSLTVFFIVASVLMATVTLILGLKSLLGMWKPLPSSPSRSGSSLIGSLLFGCCSWWWPTSSSSTMSSSSSSSRSCRSNNTTAGQDSACYQLPLGASSVLNCVEAGHLQMQMGNSGNNGKAHNAEALYCSLPASGVGGGGGGSGRRADSGCLMLTDSPGISHINNLKNNEEYQHSSLTAAAASTTMLRPHPIVSSASLSTIAASRHQCQLQATDKATKQYQYPSATLAPQTLGGLNRNLLKNMISGLSGADVGVHDTMDRGHQMNTTHLSTHRAPMTASMFHAATLGYPRNQQQQQHHLSGSSTFVPPLKLNSSSIYGQLDLHDHHQQQSHQLLHPAHLSSSLSSSSYQPTVGGSETTAASRDTTATSSGYETTSGQHQLNQQPMGYVQQQQQQQQQQENSCWNHLHHDSDGVYLTDEQSSFTNLVSDQIYQLAAANNGNAMPFNPDNRRRQQQQQQQQQLNAANLHDEALGLFVGEQASAENQYQQQYFTHQLQSSSTSTTSTTTTSSDSVSRPLASLNNGLYAGKLVEQQQSIDGGEQYYGHQFSTNQQ